jgi:hypothetical protein
MKFQANKSGFWYLIALCLASVVTYAILMKNSGSMTLAKIMLYTVACGMPFVFVFTVGRPLMSIVTVDENGVKSSAFGITLGRMRWEEMVEVGVGVQGGTRKSQYFLYFVRYHLTEEQRFIIIRMKHNNNAIWMRLTKQSMEAVTRYYHGEIRHMQLFV